MSLFFQGLQLHTKGNIPPGMVKELLDEAIRLCGGTQELLARACGVSQSAISKISKSGRASPVMAIKIDKATNGQVPRSKLRPDLFEETAA